MKQSIEVIYEDEELLIVNKPANYLTIPDRFSPDKPNLVSLLKEYYEEIRIVHRLDRETSGIICFVRSEEAHRHVSRQFEQRTLTKRYLALIDGILINKTGTIDKPIAESMAQRGKMVIAKRGKNAITNYQVLEEFKFCSLINADILTGRTHQIRIHFESQGNPLLIDSLYGKRENLFLSEIKGHRRFKLGKYTEEERPLMSRTTLHAASLSLIHPKTEELISFEAPLPKDFAAVLTQLRKWSATT